MTLKDLAKQLRGLWVIVAQFVSWGIVTIGSFIPSPPSLVVGTNKDAPFEHFAQFIGSVCVGILFVFCLTRYQRRYLRKWLVISVSVGVATTIGYFAVTSMARHWSCYYAGQDLMIGEHLTPDTISYAQQFKDPVSCQQLLADSGGDNAAVWPINEIRRRYTILQILLLGIWMSSFACIVCVAQSLRCAQQPATPAVHRRRGKASSAASTG